MGAIYRNGKPYSGASDIASAISYDHTSSGLTGDTVQEALDELSGDTVFYASSFAAYQNVAINGEYTFALKYGKIVHLVIRFTTGKYSDPSLRIIQLPDALKPSRTFYPFAGETWGSAIAQIELNAADCHIRPTNAIKTSTDYTLNCVYVTDEY